MTLRSGACFLGLYPAVGHRGGYHLTYTPAGAPVCLWDDYRSMRLKELYPQTAAGAAHDRTILNTCLTHRLRRILPLMDRHTSTAAERTFLRDWTRAYIMHTGTTWGVAR